MLVLKRYVGEDLFIGEEIVVRLEAIRRRGAQLRVKIAGEAKELWIPEDGATLIAPGVTLRVCFVRRTCARIGVEAPRSMAIRRDLSPETKRAASRLEEILRRKSG